jgi:shikimate kinase
MRNMTLQKSNGITTMADMATQQKGLIINKPVVFVGLMGAGKSRIGRDLATKIGFSFVDTDDEIVKAAGCSISDIFELYGEEAFRDLEERVISRLLTSKVQIIATGGGAFMNPQIRKIISEYGVSVWLKAGLNVLIERTSRRKGRPLLEHGDPATILKALINERDPLYGEADIVVDTQDIPIDETVNATVNALAAYIDKQLEIKHNE